MKNKKYVFGIIAALLILGGCFLKIALHGSGSGVLLVLGLCALVLAFMPLLAMKNYTYVFGIICVLLISTGCIFKIFHWGGGILITLGFIIFALVFMPSALTKSYKTETDSKLKKLYIIAYICIFINCMGALFKIQHWPGTEIFLMVGIPLPFVTFLPVYILQIRKNKELNYNYLLLILFFFAYFASITALLALNVSRDLLDEYIISAYHNDQRTKLANDQSLIFIERLPTRNATDSIKKESILKIKAKADDLCTMIDHIKLGVIKNTDSKNLEAIDAAGNINLWKINNKDSKSINFDIMYPKMTELKNNLITYKQMLASLNTNETELNSYINHVLNISENWQFEKIDGKSIVSLIDALNALKSNIALAELETLSAIEG
jgi:hypothetical protein